MVRRNQLGSYGRQIVNRIYENDLEPEKLKKLTDRCVLGVYFCDERELIKVKMSMEKLAFAFDVSGGYNELKIEMDQRIGRNIGLYVGDQYDMDKETITYMFDTPPGINPSGLDEPLGDDQSRRVIRS